MMCMIPLIHGSRHLQVKFIGPYSGIDHKKNYVVLIQNIEITQSQHTENGKRNVQTKQFFLYNSITCML